MPRIRMVVLLGLCALATLIGGADEGRPAIGRPAEAQGADGLQRARELSAEVAQRIREGRYPEALPKAREALALRERALGPDHLDVAQSLASLALLLRETSEYAEARSHYERVLRIREQKLGPTHPAVAATLSGLGYVLFLTGDYGEARPILERSLQIREQALGPTHPDVGDSLTNLGLVFYATGDYAAARPLLERALRIRESALGPNDPILAYTLISLGRVLRDSGDYRAARPLLERSLQIRERALGPNHPAVAGSLGQLGLLLQLTGDYGGARPLVERALRIREQAFGPNHPEVAAGLNELGSLLEATSDYAGARPLYERALRIREQVFGPNHSTVAQSLVALATLDRTAGAYAAARPPLERALRIREQTLGPNHPAVAGSLGQLAFLLYLTGDYAEARPLYERALAIREATLGPNHRDVAGGLNALGLLLEATGDYAGARARFERGLRIVEQALGPSNVQLAPMLNNLGRVLRRTGDLAGARPILERGLRIREQALGASHPDVAASLDDLAALLQGTGDYAGARPLYERALQIREQAFGPTHPVVAATLTSLAFLLNQTANYAEARPLYERALRIREQTLRPDHPAIAWTLNSLAFHYRVTGNDAAARPLYERALPIARTAGIPELRWRLALGLGRTYETAGRLADALPLYRESVTALEGLAGQFADETQRAQFLQAENRLTPYDALTRVLLKLHERDSGKGYDLEAWAVLEAKKGRVVADALSAARPKPRDPLARQEAERVEATQQQARTLERALQEEQDKAASEGQAERVQNLGTLLAQTKAEYLGQVQAFLARYPQYRAQFVDQQTVDPKALAKFAGRLPAGTLAVQYFSAPDALYVFVVAPGGNFRVKSQPVPQHELYALVKEYRERIERAATQRLSWVDDGSEAYRAEVAPFKAVTAKLAGYLLAPIEAELATHPNLILFPNDLLLYLPIHALTRKQPDGSTRFLAETHIVSYVTQLELMDALAAAKPEAAEPVLALANPDGSLPAASREVRELARARPAVTTLEGAEATKSRFVSLVSQFPEIHLATHGVLDPERPDRSYLLLAGDTEASQRLTIGEIAGLSLSPRALAILSGCETALGEQVPGAALVTLAAAFSQAGSQSIVASLWKVSDAATRNFMVAFHRTLPTTGRAAALQQAQLAVLKSPQTAHPFYWAAFILIGGR